MSSPSALSKTFIKRFTFDHTNSNLPYLKEHPQAHCAISFYREKPEHPFDKGAIVATYSYSFDEKPSTQISHTLSEDRIFVRLSKLHPPLPIRFFTERAQINTISSAQTKNDFRFVTNTEDESLSIVFLNHAPIY